MKFKGIWSSDTTYDVGDVVIYEMDNLVYILQNPADAGTDCHNTLYWGRIEKPLAEAVLMIMDALTIAMEHGEVAAQNAVENYFPDGKTIRLASSTASSVKIFDITVDDSGDVGASEHGGK